MDCKENPAFVFIHGAWHNHHTWDKVVPLLADRGYASVAIDLPGAGTHAARPRSFAQRPLDAAAFATEPSPNAAVTQTQRNDAAMLAVHEAVRKGNGKVVLVGHSLGGVTVSQLGEREPDLLHAVVYLAAVMLPAGMTAAGTLTGESMSGGQLQSLLMADPEEVGAFRLDTASVNDDYVGRVKETFYRDVDDDDFKAILSGLHPDEPAQVFTVPSPVTKEHFGRVPRHYIRLTEDLTVLIEAQDEMIRWVDEQMGNATRVHSMKASHSPFLSMPEALADILVATAA